jgi:hypothetical protein
LWSAGQRIASVFICIHALPVPAKRDIPFTNDRVLGKEGERRGKEERGERGERGGREEREEERKGERRERKREKRKGEKTVRERTVRESER